MQQTLIESLKGQRETSLKASAGGPPLRTSNPFFGVGPITDGALDEADSRLTRLAFEHWLEANYRKLDDTGKDIGPFTVAEIARSMHRGYPADKFLLDMMREIHRYFRFPRSNKMAVGLGGGHSGFTVCALHLLTCNDPSQHIYVDTLAPESEEAKASGFFRQSWGAQIVEMLSHARQGDPGRVHFAKTEGGIPSSDTLERLGIKVFFGVGHETTGATCYTKGRNHSTARLDRSQPWRTSCCSRRYLDAWRHALGRGHCEPGHVEVLPLHALPEGNRRRVRLLHRLLHAAGSGAGRREPESPILGHSAPIEACSASRCPQAAYGHPEREAGPLLRSRSGQDAWRGHQHILHPRLRRDDFRTSAGGKEDRRRHGAQSPVGCQSRGGERVDVQLLPFRAGRRKPGSPGGRRHAYQGEGSRHRGCGHSCPHRRPLEAAFGL